MKSQGFSGNQLDGDMCSRLTDKVGANPRRQTWDGFC